MPFKSEAQRQKFAQMLKEGTISQEVFNEWNADTPDKLPDRTPKKVTIIRRPRATRGVAK